MASSDQEDILRRLEEMRKELDSFSWRFVQVEQTVEAHGRQLETVVQEVLRKGRPVSAPHAETTDVSPGGQEGEGSPAGPQAVATPQGFRPSGPDQQEAPADREPAAQADRTLPRALSEYIDGSQGSTGSTHTYQDRKSNGEPAKDAGSKDQKEHDAESAHPKDAASQGLETRIGSLWLNRLGVAVFLIGVVSLLLYSFQYFGPFPRDLVGIVIAAVVIWFSHFRSKSAPEHRTFFEGLNALGWSLGYFVAYGMFFIEPLKVVPSILVELPILLAVAAGGMADAVAFNSEATAIMSSSFAFGSLILCAGSVDPTLFNLAFLVIAAALTFGSIRKSWFAALFVCCCFFFGSIFYCNFLTHISLYSGGPPVPVPGLLLNIILIAGWLMFNSAIWMLKELPEERRWAVIGLSLISAFCFPGLLNHTIELQQPGWEPATRQAWIYGLIGSFYLFSARFLKGQRSDDLWSLQYLVGLSLINTSRWLKLSGDTGLVSDLCEVALLTYCGLRFNIPMFRYFAAIWSWVALVYWGANAALLLLAVLSCSTCAYVYTMPAFREVQSTVERAVFGPYYYVLANIFCVHMVFADFPSDWQFSGLVLLAAINVVLSLKLRWKTSIAVAGIILYLFGASALFASTHTVPACIASVAVCFAVYYYCRDLFLKTKEKLEKVWKIVFAIFGNCVVFQTICVLAPQNCISAGWGLHGLILIILGFILLEKTFRILALSLFALLTLRLLFFDLASAPAIERIVSFIVAGAVFVGCSYIYTWFSKNILEAGEAGAAAEEQSRSGTDQPESKAEADAPAAKSNTDDSGSRDDRKQES